MSTPQIWICSVCHRTLDLRTDDEGAHLQHTVQDALGDHEPVPIPADSTWVPRCDFCSADEVTHRVPARDFDVPHLANHHSAGDWAACAGCARLIAAGEWAALRLRVADVASTEWGVPMSQAAWERMGMLYLALRQAVTGPPEPIRPPGDEPR